MIPLLAVVAVTAATVVIGAYGVRVARAPADFLVASRTVPPLWNASAMSGEYLSAASFLGVAGLIMRYGVDMLWYPVGFAAGYLMLLLLVAAPLRRFGAYTLPDFAEGRLDSPRVRRVATAFVLVIGWFYLVPQFRGAGITLRALFGAPYWVGVVVAGVVVTGNVVAGGMRGVTFVQAFQYWVMITAICVPAVVLLGVYQADGRPPLAPDDGPVFGQDTTVAFRAGAQFTVTAPVVVGVDGDLNGRALDGHARLGPGTHAVGAGTALRFPAGAQVPHARGLPVARGREWVEPFGPAGGLQPHPVFFTYSLILATFLGTMGLPHIVVRFFTNADGAAARTSTVLVLVLIGAFYLFPTVYGVLGRRYTPDLYLTGTTDAVVLTLPGRMVGGLGGELLTGLVAAGAFAAFLSTASGLLVSLGGALAYDVLRGGVRDFRRAALGAGGVGVLLAFGVAGIDIGVLVGWAFAIAASTFCPLLVLGIWWRGLTAVGAAAGMIAGGGLATAAVLATMVGVARTGWPAALLSQPAAWTVPVAFGVMIAGSVLTRARRPVTVGASMLAMHAPDRLGLAPLDARPGP